MSWLIISSLERAKIDGEKLREDAEWSIKRLQDEIEYQRASQMSEQILQGEASEPEGKA
jgi:hypothetical protein